MAFNTVNQKPRTYTRVHEVRFAITNTPTSRNGRLTVPAAALDVLGWEADMCLEVLAGVGDDTGWFGLKPITEDVRHRAKLKIRSNGVGQFNSQALVPDEVHGTIHTFNPETRVDGSTLYIKVF